MQKIWEFEKYRDNVALKDEFGKTLTYEELIKESQNLFSKIGKRCLVFSLCRNSLGSVVGYVSFLNFHIVPVMLSSSLEKKLLDNLLETYCPEFLWVPKDETFRFPQMTEEYRAFDYVLLKTNYGKVFDLNEKLALLITTSGSTGSPKLVRQSYENILSNAESIVQYLELNQNERPITTLPMNYVYGLSIINSHLLVGATLLLTEKGIMQKEFWNFFKTCGATSFGGVPYTYEMLDRMRFYRMNLPSLRTLTQAGGKMLPEMHEKFARYALENGKNLVIMYGASEATARMGYLPPQKALEKKGSMGIPIPGGKFILKDSSRNEISRPHVVGELVYEGKNVTLGYAESGEDLVRGDDRHGVLETGDMAEFDEDGFFYIVGRKKRFLKIFGNRVNLDEIDRMIKGQFNIEVASAGIDDKMYVFVTNGEVASNLISFLVEKTKLNHAAFNVVTLSEIPKNESGKILYNELAQYYEKK